MGVISGFVVISITVTIFYCIGLLSFLAGGNENKCEMTYMFQYPQFVRIRLKEEAQFPRYVLYAYSEGSLTYRVRDMKFDGVPVLYVPGNAGSYKQARSLASVALRKALDSRPGYHFDFFTIDLNEELSGLTGLVLKEQMSFLNCSIHRILSLYDRNKPNAPKSVILIGHSMGGVISQGLLTLSQVPQPVSLLITLASPHRRPTVTLDSYMADFYDKLSKSTFNNSISLVTLSGGHDDFLVPTTLTYLANNTVHAASTFVPLTWVMADHKCVVWCKQLVLAIIRCLFDSIDLQTKQLSTDIDYRKRVLEHHLVQNSGIKMRHLDKYNFPIKMDDLTSEWLENINRQYSLKYKHGSKKTNWHMIRILPDNRDHMFVTVLAVNLEAIDWVFACAANHLRGSSRVCLDGIHLTQHSQMVPSIRYKRKMYEVNMHQLKKNHTELTHVVIRVPFDDEPTVLYVDIYNPRTRKIAAASLPKWWKFNYQTLIKETLPEAVYYEVSLPEHNHYLYVYELLVSPLHCSSKFHHSTASFIVPWAHYDVHQYFTEIDKKPLILRLLGSRPANQDSIASVKLTLDPNCRYTVAVRFSLLKTLGQFARLYSPMLIANIAAVALMALRGQLVSISDTSYCQLFHSALSTIVKPYYIITFAKLFSKLTLPDVLPKADAKILSDEATDFFLLPIVLYVIGVGLLYILSGLIVVALICYESAFHKVAMKVLAKTIATPTAWSDWIMKGFNKLPCVVAATLVCLSVFACGALSLCLGTMFYFLKLTYMYQDYIEDLVVRILKKLGSRFRRNRSGGQRRSFTTSVDNDVNEAKTCTKNGQAVKEEKDSSNEKDGGPGGDRDDSVLSGMHFHFALFVLWIIVAAINVPVVLTWAHNFKFNPELTPDPSFLPGILLSVYAIPLWQLDIPKVDKTFYKEIGYVLYATAILCLIYAPVSVYRLNYLLTFAMGIITLHQLIAPKRSDDNETEQQEQHQESISNNVSKSLNALKSKIE